MNALSAPSQITRREVRLTLHSALLYKAGYGYRISRESRRLLSASRAAAKYKSVYTSRETLRTHQDVACSAQAKLLIVALLAVSAGQLSSQPSQSYRQRKIDARHIVSLAETAV